LAIDGEVHGHLKVDNNVEIGSRGSVKGEIQAKLVRVTSGRVLDVAVDIRRGSPSFGRFVMQELSADNHYLLFAPEGFAHGFLVLSDEADFQYKCSDFYAPKEERGIHWNDTRLAIPWPLEGRQPLVNDRDAAFPTLDQAPPEDLPVYVRPGA
jgi:dTDP-4-dehydrorhamnose 3,5-epimerase